MSNVNQITNVKPVFAGIDKTKGTFQSDGTQYSQAGVQYSQAGVFWGGHGRRDDKWPTMLPIIALKPILGVSKSYPVDAIATVIIPSGQPMGLLWYITYPVAGTEIQNI